MCITAPVSLAAVKVEFFEDGSTYLVDKDSGERVCKAYGFESAAKGWRARVSFFAKEGEEGFWASFDDRKVVKTLD
jgi:hypothetical protein